MTQAMLFDAEPSEEEAPFIPQTRDDGAEWGAFDSCLVAFRTNACTLDGKPARVIGTSDTASYATIEPLDVDAEPIRCCWEVVDMALSENGGRFQRPDDDTDE